MDIVKCAKCKEDVTLDYVNAVTDDGEVWMCPKCGYKFRYVTK